MSAARRGKTPRPGDNIKEDMLSMPLPDLACLDVPETPEFSNGLNKEVFDHMEVMLRHIHKSQDPHALVDRLRLCFGSGSALYRADRYVLEQLGMNRLDAMFFSLVPELYRYSYRTSFGEHPRVGCLAEATDYLISNFIGLQDEYFYLFCVNMHGKLKARVLLHKGIEDRALFSLNKLMTEVLRAEPAAVIVAHNHPRGTLCPSQGDLLCTMDIINASPLLNAPLLDHVIVAGKNAVSIRDNGFIPESRWMAQAPDNRFLKNWLKPAPVRSDQTPKVLTPEQQAAALEKKRRKLMDRAKREYRICTRKADHALRVYQHMQALLAPKNED